MTNTLVVVRHAKSDWSMDVGDRERPLADRGRRQAPQTGRWLAEHGLIPDLAVVSAAVRATQTWDLLAPELGGDVTVSIQEAAYTFEGEDLIDLVRSIPPSVRTAALVGHNPALEAFVGRLTGVWVLMPTSALAVLELPSWAQAGVGTARLQTAGRPADGRGFAAVG